MKIVIASDSFKGSASSKEVAMALRQGLLYVEENLEVDIIVVADGGEGTCDALYETLGGRTRIVQVSDPLGRLHNAKYLIISKDTALMEVAEASGLTLLREEDRDPYLASSFGTGEMILDALNQGIRTFYIGIGGSATNDAGAGMLQALGVCLRDKNGKEISRGAIGLRDICSLDTTGLDSRIQESEFNILTDVDNPLCGMNGASYVFGPQKGATNDDCEILDGYVSNFAEFLDQHANISISNLPGAGAAGGLGAAFMSVLKGNLKPGIHTILDLIGFDSKIESCDLLITGEGKLDASSLSGKTPIGIAQRGKKYNVPVIAVVGAREMDIDKVYDHGIDLVINTCLYPMSLDYAIENTRDLLVETGKTIARILQLK